MNNNTNQTDDFLEVVSVMNVIFGSVCVAGVIGNTVVLTVILLVRTVHTTVNLCLGCLAVVDIVVLALNGLWDLVFSTSFSFFERYLCVLDAVHFSFLVCSHLIFLLIGLERYTLLCHPLKSLGWWTLRKVCLILGVIFVISAGVAIPNGISITYEQIIREDNTTTVSCLYRNHSWLIYYDTVLICVTCFFPTAMLVWLYSKMIIALKAKVPQRSDVCEAAARGASKSRSQTIVMLSVVVAVFVVCVLPVEIYDIVTDYSSVHMLGMSLKSYTILVWFLRALLYVNHASNPVVYFLMCNSFRQAFKSAFCIRHRLRRDD